MCIAREQVIGPMAKLQRSQNFIAGGACVITVTLLDLVAMSRRNHYM
jgi:hypothetical protein